MCSGHLEVLEAPSEDPCVRMTPHRHYRSREGGRGEEEGGRRRRRRRREGGEECKCKKMCQYESVSLESIGGEPFNIRGSDSVCIRR